MLYTQEYLEAVEKAICDLQLGKRVISVSYGDTHVQYAPINLTDLLKLRSQIKAGLSETNSRKRQVIKLLAKVENGILEPLIFRS